MEELLVSSLAQTDALAKLLIEKGVITRESPTQPSSIRGCSEVKVDGEALNLCRSQDWANAKELGAVCAQFPRLIEP